MTFSIDNPEGGLQQPPLGKYVWEKPSGEQGLSIDHVDAMYIRLKKIKKK